MPPLACQSFRLVEVVTPLGNLLTERSAGKVAEAFLKQAGILGVLGV